VVIFSNTNGVRPAIPAAGMLRAILEDLDLPARDVALWPETVAAAAAFDSAIIGSGAINDAAAITLFSPNLLSDVPADVRDTRLAKVIAEIGGLLPAADLPPLVDRLAWTISAAHVAFTIPGVTGSLLCRIEMTPTTPSMVQRLDIDKTEPLTRLSPVTRHYRPLA
jgi:hypothetical protein